MRCRLSALIVVVLLAGCAQDAPRAPAERRNLRALDTIPAPPGAEIVRTETFGRTASDTSDGPIDRWTTIRDLHLTRPTSAARAIAGFRRSLVRAGWRVTERADFYLNARRGRSCLHALTSPDAVTRREPVPGTVAADSAPPRTTPDPGRAAARGLLLSVTDC